MEQIRGVVEHVTRFKTAGIKTLKPGRQRGGGWLDQLCRKMIPKRPLFGLGPEVRQQPCKELYQEICKQPKGDRTNKWDWAVW